jgi:hypothetical protein
MAGYSMTRFLNTDLAQTPFGLRGVILGDSAMQTLTVPAYRFSLYVETQIEKHFGRSSPRAIPVPSGFR